MKITIDTDNKTIQVDEPICFGDLVQELKELLPDGWSGYKFIPSNATQYYPVYPYPTFPETPAYPVYEDKISMS